MTDISAASTVTAPVTNPPSTSLFDKIVQGVETDATIVWDDVKGVFVSDIEPAITAAIQLIERNGGQLLITEALAALSGLATGNWTGVVTTLVANAKAAGAQTITSEEQLAGSTALQIAQVLNAQQTATASAQTT
jgi:hypothetical protein